MPTTIATNAVEKSTYIITASFTDEEGTKVTPTVLHWSLTDVNGNIINDRKDVSITPAESVNIVLHGDDLVTEGIALPTRIVYIYGLYDSTFGNNLELKDEVRFSISDLVNVT